MPERHNPLCTSWSSGLLMLLLSLSSQALEVRVSDSRENNFYMDALVWVLDKSGVDYQLTHTDHPISTQRRKVNLLLNNEIDVIYAGTTNELESQLSPIRVPITRGYIGNRLLLINKQLQSDYDDVSTLDQLKQHTAALGFGWPEVEIFRAAGLNLNERIYDEIFVALNEGSRYYFSRGLLEVYPELSGKRQSLKNITIENHLMLKYKSAVFFFVHPNNKALQAAIEQGFQRAYEDDSYLEFFYNHPYIKASLAKSDRQQRTVISIDNPFFPEASDNIPEKYWHTNEPSVNVQTP